MLQQVWAGENRSVTVCVDAYEDGVMKGQILNACRETEPFEGLVQFLMIVDRILEDQQIPQAYTALRKFSDLIQTGPGSAVPGHLRKGAKATFVLQILFRQHSSWQGVIVWRERKLEQSFRSVLELVMLMDSALRSAKEGVA